MLERQRRNKYFVEKDLTEKQKVSNKEKKALNCLIKNRNLEICDNDTDKNLAAISVVRFVAGFKKQTQKQTHQKSTKGTQSYEMQHKYPLK